MLFEVRQGVLFTGDSFEVELSFGNWTPDFPFSCGCPAGVQLGTFREQGYCKLPNVIRLRYVSQRTLILNLVPLIALIHPNCAFLKGLPDGNSDRAIHDLVHGLRWNQ